MIPDVSGVYGIFNRVPNSRGGFPVATIRSLKSTKRQRRVLAHKETPIVFRVAQIPRHVLRVGIFLGGSRQSVHWRAVKLLPCLTEVDNLLNKLIRLIRSQGAFREGALAGFQVAPRCTGGLRCGLEVQR